jgi:hypothetical protein
MRTYDNVNNLGVCYLDKIESIPYK